MASLSNSPGNQVDVQLERRKSWSVKVVLSYDDGSRMDLTGYTLRLVVKPEEFDDDQYDVTNMVVNSSASIPMPSNGTAVFNLQAAELDQAPGAYFGALVMWTPAGYSLLLARLMIQLRANAESDSIHQLYQSANPAAALELGIRGADVINITASNLVEGRPGDKGDPGKPGTDGTSIIVTDNGDGTLSLEAAAPAVTDNGDGTFTVGA